MPGVPVAGVAVTVSAKSAMRALTPPVASLLAEVRACTLCAPHLPLGPRPILQFHPSARILIAAQAPGRKVHETGIPFNDASGDRLRDWLGGKITTIACIASIKVANY